MNTDGGGPVEPLEAPVVAFPLRGRLNPYYWFLLPLIFISIFAYITACGALISVSVAVQNQTIFESEVDERFQTVRIVGILLYSIVLSITSTLAMTYMFNLCNFLDTKYAPIFLDALNLIAIFTLVPLSTMMIAVEAALPESDYEEAVNQGAYFISGVLGLSSAGLLSFGLFFSRFYEFCIGNYKHKKSEILDAAELAARVSGFGDGVTLAII